MVISLRAYRDPDEATGLSNDRERDTPDLWS
jgi:hypothetical protein